MGRGSRSPAQASRRGHRFLVTIGVLLLMATAAAVFLVMQPAAGPGVAEPPAPALPLTDPHLTIGGTSDAAAVRIAELLSAGRAADAAESVCVADRDAFLVAFDIPDGWELAVTSRGTFENGDYATARFWLTGTETATGDDTTTTLTQTLARNDQGGWLWCSGKLGPEDSAG